jgi:hypothetical protein
VLFGLPPEAVALPLVAPPWTPPLLVSDIVPVELPWLVLPELELPALPALPELPD